MLTSFLIVIALTANTVDTTFRQAYANYNDEVIPSCWISWKGDYYQWQDAVIKNPVNDFNVDNYIDNIIIPKSRSADKVDYIYIDDLLKHLCNKDVLFDKKLARFSYYLGYKFTPEDIYTAFSIHFKGFNDRVLVENFKLELKKALRKHINLFSLEPFRDKEITLIL